MQNIQRRSRTKMTENNFEKTTDLPLEKVAELIDDYGLLKLSKVPVGFHIIAKILKPFETKIINEGTDDEFAVNTVEVEYEPKGYEPAQFKMQVGEGPIKRVMEKFPDNKYVGMHAFFKRSKFGGKFPQHINPFVQSEGSGPGSKPTFVKKKGQTGIVEPKQEGFNNQPEFVKEIIAHFCENPDDFQNNYMQASARDGVTAPWEFIDSFNEAAAEDNTQYSHDEIIKVYNQIITATMGNRI